MTNLAISRRTIATNNYPYIYDFAYQATDIQIYAQFETLNNSRIYAEIPIEITHLIIDWPPVVAEISRCWGVARCSSQVRKHSVKQNGDVMVAGTRTIHFFNDNP